MVIVIAASGGGDGSETAPQTSTSTPSREEKEGREQKEQKAQSVGIGDPVRDGKFEFTVTKVQAGLQRIGGEFGDDAQGQFILVYIAVENIGDKSQLFDGSDQKLFDAKNRQFSADTGAALYLEGSESFLNNINPGNKVNGIVVFDIPKSVKPVKLELHDSIFSGGVAVSLIPS